MAAGRVPRGVKTSPQSHLGPRKAAVMARKRLPLGNAPGQIRSGSEVKDYLEGLEEPPSREGWVETVCVYVCVCVFVCVCV